ncbi:MAG: hypothetical protein FWD64_00870 [Acidobacteriaceae bacterium]|nr:hypothetical protein [Acidobacteriaceae bacterium]
MKKNVLWIVMTIMGITGVVMGCHADGPATDQLAQLLKDGKVKEYTRCVAEDQKLGIEAARTIVPAGWTCQGQVTWNLQSGVAPAVYEMSAQSPDKKESILYFSTMAFEEPRFAQIGMMNMQQAQLYREGMQTDSGNPMLKLMSSSDYTVYMLKGINLGLQNIRVIEVKPLSAEAQAAVDKSVQDFSAMMTQASRSMPGSYFRDVKLDARVVVLSATRNGKPCKLAVYAPILSYIRGIQNNGMHVENLPWTVARTAIYSAESDAYNDESIAVKLFAANFVTNQQWQASIDQAIKEIGEKRVAELRRQGQAAVQRIQQQAQAYARINKQNYDNTVGASIQHRSDVNSAVLGGWDDVISGVENYRAQDGGVLKVDQNFDHVYVGKTSGKIYTTQGVKLDSDRYTQLQHIPLSTVP